MAFLSAETAAYFLIEEFLQALRSSHEPTPDDDIDLAIHVDRRQSLTPDHVVAAQMLAVTLSPHFQTLDDLAKSAAFIAMPVRDIAEGYLLASILKATLSDSIVTIGPRFEPDRRRFIIFVGGSANFERMAIVKAAAKHGYPVLWLYDQDVEVPEEFVAIVDLKLECSVITTEILSRTFQEMYGLVPVNISAITKPAALSPEDFALRLRGGRSPEACIDSLVAALPKELVVLKQGKTLHTSHGYGNAKVWGLELAQDFKEWRLGKLNWHAVDHRAVLLTGVPGVGKTSFAALLAETLEVPLISTSVAEWNGHEHLSGTLKRMRAVFEKAMAEAPCVLLIDEIDGISSRQHIEGRHTEYWTQIVNQMLELVTQATNTEGLVMVGATNFVGRIDPALTRAGRLEQTITIEPPDVEAITMILFDSVGPGFTKRDLRIIAERLHSRTGADVERLVRTAKATARRAGQTLTIADLANAIKDPLDTLSTPERRRMAVYRAGQIVVAQALGLLELGDMGSARPNSRPSERIKFPAFPTEQFFNDVIAFLMAGMAAEEIMMEAISVFGANPNSSDLAIATSLARELEMRSGIGEIGLVDLETLNLQEGVPPSVIGSVRRRIDAAMARASNTLMENESELVRIVDGLIGPRGSVTTRLGYSIH